MSHGVYQKLLINKFLTLNKPFSQNQSYNINLLFTIISIVLLSLNNFGTAIDLGNVSLRKVEKD